MSILFSQPVKTFLGDKAISSLSLQEDRILTFDEYTGVFEYVYAALIAKSTTAKNKPKLYIQFDNGQTITVTDDHKLLTAWDNQFTPARYLRIGDSLKTQNRDLTLVDLRILSIKKIYFKEEDFSVPYWDCAISMTHNYVLDNGIICQ